jgi:hypothetical protein
MPTFARCVLLLIAVLALSASEAPAVIKATSPLKLFVRDATQIVRVRVAQFAPDKNRLVFDVEEDIKGNMEQRKLPVVWKIEPDSKWEGIRALPRLLKCFGPDQEAILFINDAGGFWHNKGATRKYPIAFGFTSGSWFCMESTKLDDGKLLWKLAQGEPYLRTTFKGTTAELNQVLVDHLAGKGKLPEPVKEEPGFGPEYRPPSMPTAFVRFTRDGGKQVTGFTLSTSGCTNIAFVKRPAFCSGPPAGHGFARIRVTSRGAAQL